MSFHSVFIALVIGFSLVLAALLINARRPPAETAQPTAALVRATGKCAECHDRLQHSVVHEYQLSAHAAKRVSCLDCHQPAAGQRSQAHHSFVISKSVTSANCRGCHEPVYQQFVRSRHAAPSWAAVYGEEGLSPDQVAFSERYHPGGSKRSANPLVKLEGEAAMASGCVKCHSIGKPNADGTIGNCTACHTRHTSSVAIARLPTTCGQCHMGPDHSQLEIYEESKHGLLFTAQEKLLNLEASPRELSTRDMFIPTCATCHMSGLNGTNVTHDPGERLSYWLFAEVSEKRPHYLQAQERMKEICSQCHTQSLVNRVYDEAEKIVVSTNDKVKSVRDVMTALKQEGLLGKEPFQTSLDFEYFDLWHYYGRTSKHGAFMGGADFTQWHGNYPLLKATVEITEQAEELRRKRNDAAK